MLFRSVRPNMAGSAENPEVVSSKKLLPRLNKMYNPESGRLQEAVGEENSQSLINHASTATVAENKLASTVIENSPEFSTLPSTESKALREIVRPHVSSGTLGASVDYKGVLKNFDALSPSDLKARFANPEAVRSALVKAQTIQRTKLAVGGIAATAVGADIGWKLAH